MSPAGMVSTGTCVTDPRPPRIRPRARRATPGRCRGSRGSRGGRDLAAGRGDLAQRLAVARHVGHHHEHVPPEVEARCSATVSATAGCSDPLDQRVVGGVEQQHQLAGRRRAPRGAPARPRRRRGSRPWPRTTTANGSPPHGGLRGDLGGQLEVRAGRRRRRSAASARARAWSARRSPRHRSAPGRRGSPAAAGLIGQPADRRGASCRRRRPAVERLAAAVAHPAEPRLPTGTRSGPPANETRVPSRREPVVPSSTCTTARSPSTSSTTPWRISPDGEADLGELVPARRPRTPSTHEQRTVDQLTDVEYSTGARGAHAQLPEPRPGRASAIAPDRGRRRRARPPRGPASTARSRAPRSLAAGRRAATSLRAAVVRRRARASTSAACFSGGQ